MTNAIRVLIQIQFNYV